MKIYYMCEHYSSCHLRGRNRDGSVLTSTKLNSARHSFQSVWGFLFVWLVGWLFAGSPERSISVCLKGAQRQHSRPSCWPHPVPLKTEISRAAAVSPPLPLTPQSWQKKVAGEAIDDFLTFPLQDQTKTNKEKQERNTNKSTKKPTGHRDFYRRTFRRQWDLRFHKVKKGIGDQ